MNESYVMISMLLTAGGCFFSFLAGAFIGSRRARLSLIEHYDDAIEMQDSQDEYMQHLEDRITSLKEKITRVATHRAATLEAQMLVEWASESLQRDSDKLIARSIKILPLEHAA